MDQPTTIKLLKFEIWRHNIILIKYYINHPKATTDFEVSFFS